MLTLLYHGSVKDLYDAQDGLVFHYSDRYSIFDWGEMPDLIEDKGLNLAKMHVWSYRYLESNEVRTHLKDFYLGQVSSRVLVERCQKYSFYFDNQERKFRYQKPENQQLPWALPLEVVFRFDVFKNSSFFNRAQRPGYLDQMGYSMNHAHLVKESLQNLPPDQDYVELPYPVVEFFSKLEPIDRLLSQDEILQIIGFDRALLTKIAQSTIQVATLLRNRFREVGIQLHDGKLEWGILPEDQQLILIDSIGPDEMRLSFDQVPLSKEILRYYYRNTDWYHQIQEAKQKAQDNQDPNWRKYLNSNSHPPKLPEQWKKIMSCIYHYFACLGENPKLQLDEELIQKIKGLV